MEAKQADKGNPANKEQESAADFDTLVDLITDTIHPLSWHAAGGSGAIETFQTNLSLVVSQTEEVHGQIAELLRRLRLKQSQVVFEMRVIGVSHGSADTLRDMLLSEYRAAGSGLSAAQAREVLQAVRQDEDAKITELPKVTLFNEQSGGLSLDSQKPGFGIQLHPTVDLDGRIVMLRYRVGSIASASDLLAKKTPTKINDKGALLLDVTESLRPETLGWAESVGVPMLDKIPYTARLFKNPSRQRVEKVYLLITPRIVVEEEE